MRIENTAENKAKFFALYWGQKIARVEIIKDKLDLNEVGRAFSFPNSKCMRYLGLTPLSQITDEDAIDVFDLLFSYSETHKNKPKDFKIEFGKDWASIIFNDAYGHFFPKDYVQMIDFLRSKGYALPWMGVSVETLVEWGWVKLKSQNK